MPNRPSKRPRHSPKAERTVDFGPFADVPESLIAQAGFDCPLCCEPVRRAGLAHPAILPRMMFYSCGCQVSVACWEDERQPSGPDHWRCNVELGKASKVELVMFNGDKATPASFQGRN